MDCTGVAGVLVAYHLGSVTDDERDQVEAHLVACASCLKTYLALKRAADRAGKLERPRSEVRDRLRAEVARTFAPTDKRASSRPVSQTVSPFRKRIPLYQGVALAAIAAAVALALPNVLHWADRSTSHIGEPSIDTSRTRAESLHIY